MTVHKDSIDQARSEMIKIVRTAIRLRHSIEADRELNEVLPRAQAKFDAAVQKGQLPAALDIKKSLGL